MAAFAADAATLGSTTDARKATVDIIGLPALLKGMGWYASGPSAPPKHIAALKTLTYKFFPD